MKMESNEYIGMVHSYQIESGNFTKAGEAASGIKKLLRQLGVDAKIIRRVSVAAYEAEMNMVIHSTGGVIEIEVNPKGITFKAVDEGPGIEDISRAMEEGFSTAKEWARELGFGAGMGLPNIKRCCDDFHIQSQIGQGTCLEARFSL
ncbi:MAG TPA: ATP-binding protein [Clostridia bacterium]|nr:ATP-binding protein [Clostridia bacterium]